ncbi:MAG: hypothetical protein CMG46_03105 [Candidatus Marinimicrobia bacterium]|nr:hypothetical protein [Candidatus Neomarinimicrobiota bacterium]
MWVHKGLKRPNFAIVPRQGQESVWDYPRPPAVVADRRKVEIFSKDGRLIGRSERSVRILETASPPTFYIPAEDVFVDLSLCEDSSFCEWKGRASYFLYRGDKLAWRYDEPAEPFKRIEGCYSFYASLANCLVDGEQVRAQEGGFYGGWITNDIVGPFKGDAESMGW